jgi:hypothetical protein
MESVDGYHYIVPAYWEAVLSCGGYHCADHGDTMGDTRYSGGHDVVMDESVGILFSWKHFCPTWDDTLFW